MVDVLANYNNPPTGWESTEATHFVFFPWEETWRTRTWRSNPELEQRDNGDIVTTKCTSLWNDLPYRDGAEIITNLGHKALVIVNQERVGRDGEWHFVTVVNTNPEIDGTVGYVKVEDTLKLENQPHSLPVVFKCNENITRVNEEICAITLPVWHTTTEPYFDPGACEYLVNIVTDHTTTGGTELQQRMERQIPTGVQQLLEYYGKQRDEATVEKLLSAFQFAEAKSWNLDIKNPGSRLKVLISIPARYFDAIQPQAIDLSDFNQGSIQVATLVTSQLEQQVDGLVRLMNRFHDDTRWKKVARTYSGPEPFYGDFNFKEEAQRLAFFLENLKRFLALNDKSLRRQSDDIIEIGFNDQYLPQYIMLNDEDGSHQLNVGFNRLKQTDPFDYPRTMAYVFFLFEISNELKSKKDVQGGWPTFLKKYTFPIPEQKPSSAKGKKCTPTITDPFKCMGPQFDEYRDRHLRDFKCEELPPEKRMSTGEIGALGWEAIQTGEWDKFENKFAPFKNPKAIEAEETDIESFKLQIERENRAYNGSMDFVGDPFIEDLFSKIKAGDFKEAGYAALNEVYVEVANPFNVNKIIAKLHRCLCIRIQEDIELAELNGASEAELVSLRALSARVGCDNPCSVIPVLCSCIPIPWPIKFDFPDDLSITDILSFLTSLIINAVIEAVIDFLLGFITNILKDLLDCDRRTLNPARRQRFIDTFKNNYPWEDDDDRSEFAEALRNNQIPPELARPELMNALIKDTVLLLSPREFCELLNGNAKQETLQDVSLLMREKHPEIYAVFSNLERIRVLWLGIGATLDPEICANLDELLDSAPIEPAGYICEETSLREDMAAGRATADQINQMLFDAAKCNSDRLGSVVNLVNDLAAGSDPFRTIFNNLFQSPSNPNGIIPREPPSVQYLREVANDSIFYAVESRFYSEMNSNVPTLTTTVEVESSPRGPASGLTGFLASSLGPQYPASSFREQQRNIADSFGTKAENIDLTFGEDNNIVDIQVPERKIDVGPVNFAGDIGSNLYSGGFIPGFPTNLNPQAPNSEAAARREKIVINYSICDDSPVTTNWDLIRDTYTVTMQDTWSADNSRTILSFDGFKRINQDIVGVLGELQGGAAPSQQVFSNLLTQQWLSLPWNSLNIVNVLSNPSSPLAEFHKGAGFRDITGDLITNLAQTVARSRFVDGTSRDVPFEIAFNNLLSVEFSPHPSCNPRAPGLLNIPDIRAQMTERYQKDPASLTERYINSVQYGVAVAYLRVLIIQTVLDGMFALSQFKADEVFKSDLTLAYFLNRVKAELGAESDIYNFELWTGVPTPGDNFYEEIRMLVSKVMAERKFTDEEEFFDPFTQEPVEVLLDPRILAVELSGDHDLDELEKERLINIIDTEARMVSQQNPDESVNECQETTTLRAATQVADGECQPETPSNQDGETADGAIDPENGKKIVGYMEFFLREQFKKVTTEADILFGTEFELNEIKRQMLRAYALQTPVPAAAPLGGARLYKNFTEEKTLTEDVLREAGREDLIQIFQILSNTPEDGDFPEEQMSALVENDPVAFIRFFGAGDATTEQVIEQVRNELRETFLRPTVEALEEIDLVRPEYQYLKGGGFITEHYIKITDIGEKQWESIAEENPLAFEKIFNRDSSLKGVVNLDSWTNFMLSLLVNYNDQLGLLSETADGVELDIEKYWDKWEFGIRVAYVYPVGRTQIEDTRVREFITANLTNINGDPWNLGVEQIVKDNKAFTIKEKINTSFVVKNSDDSLFDTVPIYGDPFTFDVVTIPVAAAEMELGPTDTVVELGGLELTTILPEILDWFEGVFFKSTPGERMTLIEENADRFEEIRSIRASLSAEDGLVGEVISEERGRTMGTNELRNATISILERILELIQSDYEDLKRDAVTPVQRCFIDGNRENNVFSNRVSVSQCAEYDALFEGQIRVENWISLIQEEGIAANPVLINSAYRRMLPTLENQLIEDTQYRALFEYVFPLERFMSLVTIYTAEHVSGLPGRADLFDDTKAMLRKMYYDAERTRDEENWWKKNPAPRSEKWWERPLELSIPGILLFTPYKILQALLILVPPLNWLLDGLLSRLPALPPHRSRKGDPCDIGE